VAGLLKGALISFTSGGGALGMEPVPDVIVFQFNPETISHSWTELGSPQPAEDPPTNASPLATPGVPGETLSFTLMLDSNQTIADWETNLPGAGLAELDGVSGQLASLELLQFPSSSGDSGLVGQVSAAQGAAGLGASSCQDVPVPVSQVPVVLFSWGKELYPVRVTALSVNKKLFDRLLNPTQAEVQIGLTILTPDELLAVEGPMAKLASMAYKYNQGLREARAVANLAQVTESALGMLPIPF